VFSYANLLLYGKIELLSYLLCTANSQIGDKMIIDMSWSLCP